MGKHIRIAIDGPSGAGKSTLAKMLAKEFSLIYVDTGALYRAVGYAAAQAGIDWRDSDLVTGLLPSLSVDLKYIGGEQRVLLNGEDISGLIRTPEISMAASAVSAMPTVRAFLLGLQREIAAKNDVSMDGRDIGTVVLPDAGLKIFLSAAPEDRARRRFFELQEKGDGSTYKEVLADMIKRDGDDSRREAAPLKKADGAVAVDTTGNSLEKSYGILRGIVQNYIKREAAT